ncbi:type VII secretion protein EccB [Nocardia mangyaensis]|uniref:type VII secretion protein EccB n=1 Tax=Nocardia mangyaensis TaxID=2213200 RepID=UPI00267701D9|nr:type VII secretion protein EccB [Nocardia mangyaensis]MDO3647280.1 type VII secretion protein EccB [Nocardia mangyaensis]
MPAQLTTKAQVNGYRFLLRRLDHALVRRDVRMLHDPMRSQSRSMMVGAVLGLIIVAGAAILGFLKPQGAIGDALIVSGKQSGAMYVVVEAKEGEKTLHPVLNLASARLIAGDAQSPKSVKDDKLGSLPRGPLLGIPGAPTALPGSGQGSSSHWTLCETTGLSASGSASGASGGLTTAIVGKPETSERIGVTGADDALLVGRDDKTYLVYRGTRAEVDPQDSVLARTLEISGLPVRPMGSAVLGATTQAPPLVVPTIDRAGEPGPGKLSNVPIGGIISVTGVGAAGQETLYVVLADGVQQVSEFTADLLRNADSRGMREIAVVAPDALDRMPMLHTLPIDGFPERTPRVLTAEDAPVACVHWAKDPGEATAPGKSVDGPAERAAVTMLTGTTLPLPDSAKPVTLATADGTGDRMDAVYLPPSTGEYVQVTGVEPGSLRRESLFYVADNGIRYGIPDTATAAMLGLGDTPRLAPWSVVGQLVPGPTLSAKDALTSYDSLPSAAG